MRPLKMPHLREFITSLFYNKLILRQLITAHFYVGLRPMIARKAISHVSRKFRKAEQQVSSKDSSRNSLAQMC